MKIDIAVTATLRPKLLHRTLSTFKKMFSNDHNYRLVINIDPVGDNIAQEDIYLVARQYFNNVLPNFSKEPGFCNAFKWCAEHTTSEFVFWLEDDWELLRPVTINSLLNLMIIDGYIGSLRLNRGFVIPQKNNIICLKTSTGEMFKKVVSLYDAMVVGYVEHPDVSFNPGLFRGDYIRKVSKVVVPPTNPEDQFLKLYRDKKWEMIPKLTQAIYIGDGFDLTTRDIGRAWFETSKYVKPDSGFVYWENKK